MTSEHDNQTQSEQPAVVFQINDVFVAETSEYGLSTYGKTPQEAVSNLEKRTAEYKDWLEKGKPCPPPHIVKQQTIKEIVWANGITTFIETGTFIGEMAFILKDICQLIHSIELSEPLYQKCVERLGTYENIKLHQGDSTRILPVILNEINTTCLFWLDAHYSEGVTAKGDLETPIISELKTIAAHPIKNHLILIDDARCFNGTGDYPSFETITEFRGKWFPTHDIEIKDDIIRILPKDVK